MDHFGENWEGVCLAGEYTLGQAWEPGEFVEATRSSGERVLLKVLRRDEAGEQDRLSMWHRTAQLHHPNLLRLVGYGSEQGVCYAAFEWPDDSLSTALAQGPLSETEASELLRALLHALRYLHAQGLVYGAIEPARVMAQGDAIQLATDELREPDGERFTHAGDIAALGALVYRALTGIDFANGADLDSLPEPFGVVVRNTAGADASDRWRIPEILAALGPEASPPLLPETQPQAQPEAEPEPVEPPEIAAVAFTLPPARPVRPAAPPEERIPRWAWPASLALVIGCVAWVVYTPPKKTAPAAGPPVTTAPAAPVPAPAAAPAPAEADRQAPPETLPETARERPAWRVIAYTYHAFRDAEKRVLAINRKWPALRAEVFAPKGKQRPPFLVALGGRMNRLEAARLLQRARSHGLPRDTFMLNFSD